jgi:cellulose synthase/poly-beta-1,6-N-acetylglucosamine synthase-like glycosyltransferase
MDGAEISILSERRRDSERYGPPLGSSAAQRSLSPDQIIALVMAVVGFAVLVWFWPAAISGLLVASGAVGFLTLAAWRVLLVLVSAAPPAAPQAPPVWPRYTILAALHDEAEMVDQLVQRLGAIDYPVDRLQGLLVLEAHDHETIAAALAAPRPPWLGVFVAPPGRPLTKPRALNCALVHATGDLLTVYDAEDDPDPLQLREAAANFAADKTGRLACLQAPLRIRRRRYGVPGRSAFLDRQFTAEYAALFETALPGLARLGLPFPLGGTSNHFRTAVLRAAGGWDAWNVTEDADLGFRLWRRGGRLGVIRRPTWETPPDGLDDWLPQRTRWMKGHMQTVGVHTRRWWRLGPRGGLALVMTLCAGLVSAALHGPSLAWVTATVLIASMAGLPPDTSILALTVLALGTASAWLSCLIGARRAGVPYGPRDMAAAPAYWSMLSLAFVHAAWRLIREPFAWDKTPHRPDPLPLRELMETSLDVTPPVRLSAAHAAASEPVA